MILEEVFNLMMIDGFDLQKSLCHSMEDFNVVGQHLHRII